MNRPSRNQVLMDHAFLTSKRSTCSRLQVGALFALDGRILVSGYNGAPAGMDHCDHTCNCDYPGAGGLLFEGKHLSDCDSFQPCKTAVHAEANAIAWAARHGIRLQGSKLFTTDTPCLACAQLIVNVGAVGLYAARRYRDSAGADLLSKAGLTIVDLEPSQR